MWVINNSSLNRIHRFIENGWKPLNKWKGGRLLMEREKGFYRWVSGRKEE